jgi:hypothetical protein
MVYCTAFWLENLSGKPPGMKVVLQSEDIKMNVGRA